MQYLTSKGDLTHEGIIRRYHIQGAVAYKLGVNPFDIVALGGRTVVEGTWADVIAESEESISPEEWARVSFETLVDTIANDVNDWVKGVTGSYLVLR